MSKFKILQRKIENQKRAGGDRMGAQEAAAIAANAGRAKYGEAGMEAKAAAGRRKAAAQ